MCQCLESFIAPQMGITLSMVWSTGYFSKNRFRLHFRSYYKYSGGLFLSEVNNRDNNSAIKANNDMYCLQKWIENFQLMITVHTIQVSNILPFFVNLGVQIQGGCIYQSHIHGSMAVIYTHKWICFIDKKDSLSLEIIVQDKGNSTNRLLLGESDGQRLSVSETDLRRPVWNNSLEENKSLADPRGAAPKGSNSFVSTYKIFEI